MSVSVSRDSLRTAVGAGNDIGAKGVPTAGSTQQKQYFLYFQYLEVYARIGTATRDGVWCQLLPEDSSDWRQALDINPPYIGQTSMIIGTETATIRISSGRPIRQ